MGIFGKKKEELQQDANVAEGSVEKKSTKSTKRPVKKTDEVVSVSAAYGVIGLPVVTEKSHKLASTNKYMFHVAKDATKKQVKTVVEQMYKVTVEQVHMIVVKPKRRTVKYDRGYQKLCKKAIVTVKNGQHIAIFETA